MAEGGLPLLGGWALSFETRKAGRSLGHPEPLPSGNFQGQRQQTRRPLAGPLPEEQGEGSRSVCGQARGCQAQGRCQAVAEVAGTLVAWSLSAKHLRQASCVPSHPTCPQALLHWRHAGRAATP